MKRFLPALLVSTLTVFGSLVGCDGSTTEPIEAPIFFEGELTAGERINHNFTLVEEGTIRVELVRLQEKPAEGEEPVGISLSVGLGIGRPAGDLCSTRYSVRAVEGDVVLLGLDGADFCVQVFDSGALIGALVAEYTVSVSSN